MGNSIFDLTDKTGYKSPWKEDWTKTDFTDNSKAENDDYTKRGVQKYSHPKKTSYTDARDEAKRTRHQTFLEYKAYYEKIGKLKPGATGPVIWKTFSQENRDELNRLEKVIDDNQKLYDDAVALEKKWNKLDTHFEDVVHDFNKRKGYKKDKQLHPSLVKALMFSESEMGTSVEYLEKVKTYPKDRPAALYHLNLGRVTDAAVYNSVVSEFNIPVNWKTNYKDLGNKNDVMLCAGALMQKQRYSVQSKVKSQNPTILDGDMWFNAVVAYKGVSTEGKGKANLVYKLYNSGDHPYTASFKLH